ncbi:MAG: hypothetical protein R3Y26_01470 [Rikenellaceae bacterium]
MKKLLVLSVCMFFFVQTYAVEPLWQGKGRIVISSDGNEHDDDDWAATPMSLAIIASRSLQANVPLYTYSDHVWGSSNDFPNRFGLSAYEHMHVSALGSKYWFGYENTEFICAVDNPERAYDAMAREINLSSEDNPLFIIAAGPMQVVGEGLNRSDTTKHKYVTVISHSLWNNKHSTNPNVKCGWDHHTEGWTWDQMEESFEQVNFCMIANQNGGKDYPGLFAPKEDFEWIRTSSARNDSKYKVGAWDFLYERVACCQKKNDKYFDVSDSGMLLFLFSGIEKTSPQILEEFMCEMP